MFNIFFATIITFSPLFILNFLKQYPISTLTQQLGFENETESKHFCETWGLSVFGSNVIFEKQIQPQPPTLPWREQRSFHVRAISI